MCGIVGYIGKRQAQPILLNSLARLEYRGYDSCGIALASSGVAVYKDAVRVAELAKSLPHLEGTVGIGHTRWATHGAPCQKNAHPHTDCTGKIAVVHNGVITNYQQLTNQLTKEGHKFLSETDTEVIAHLVEKYYSGNLVDAVENAIRDIEGSYAVIVLAEDKPGIVVARKDSPLVLGIGDRENFVASDVPAVLDYTNRVMYLEDGDVGVVTPDSVSIRRDGKEVVRETQKILWSSEEAKKGGYEHFMLKEIHEQPRVIRDTISEYVLATEPVLAVPDGRLDSVLLLACGTSYHAALVGKYVFEELLGIPVRAELASEFNYFRNCLTTPLSIAITQSGETADTLKAMKRLKEAGSRVAAITNVVGSTASRIAHQTIYTRAGPEMSVAATKSFIAQLVALYWLALSFSRLDARTALELKMKLRQLPEKVIEVLDNESRIAEHAEFLAKYEDAFYIGRGINYAIAMEGALKLKEIAYIHSEAYAAGELKHGPFALLSKDTPVIAIVADDSTREAVLTNIKEIKARGSPVLAVAAEGDEAITELADFTISVPDTDPVLSPIVNTVVMQLLAYYAARKRKCPVDFPRNLAKCVTVE